MAADTQGALRLRWTSPRFTPNMHAFLETFGVYYCTLFDFGLK